MREVISLNDKSQTVCQMIGYCKTGEVDENDGDKSVCSISRSSPFFIGLLEGRSILEFHSEGRILRRTHGEGCSSKTWLVKKWQKRDAGSAWAGKSIGKRILSSKGETPETPSRRGTPL